MGRVRACWTVNCGIDATTSLGRPTHAFGTHPAWNLETLGRQDHLMHHVKHRNHSPITLDREVYRTADQVAVGNDLGKVQFREQMQLQKI